MGILPTGQAEVVGGCVAIVFIQRLIGTSGAHVGPGTRCAVDANGKVVVKLRYLCPRGKLRLRSDLFFDDDPDLLNVVSAMLRSAGFHTAGVGSAEEAFDALRDAPMDLVVLDWNLPGMSGIDFCQRLRKEDRFARLPILFLTAHSSTADVVTAFKAGADDFVSKPFRGPELAARVLSLVRRSQLPPPSARRP